jgi:RNase adapter protein RapZ
LQNNKDKKLLVLIMGRSGAGITSSVKAMQDIGLFVIDNLPLSMAESTLESMEASSSQANASGYAIGVHTYSSPSLGKLNDLKERLKDRFVIDVIFLKAKVDVLAKRFSTSRRPHPFHQDGQRLTETIQQERAALIELEKNANLVINTTELSPHVLARYLEARFSGHTPRRKLLVSISSFGYKHNISTAYDLVFDVRFLKNPYFVQELRSHTGMSDEVADYVRSDERYQEFSQKIHSLIEFLLPQYFNEGKAYLRIGIGCTGGKHRSVTFARDLTEFLRSNSLDFIQVTIDHKDIQKR